MYLSLDWLKDYVDIPKSLTPEELGLRLTMHTVEIDGVFKEADKFKNVIVGKIKSVRMHPNADKLRIAIVEVPGKELTIVCGAPNIEAGQRVPVAMIGAVLPNGMEIKPAEIRGEKSEGMLCAADELGLGSDHSGILILDKKAKIGEPLGQLLKLKDVIYEVDNKSITNRPDLWGHYGMAREIAAFLGAKFKDYKTSASIMANAASEFKVNVRVEDKKLCPRYMAVAIDGIKIKASPEWMQKRLLAAGVRPISNIVDITNYVMLEFGQPLHAFDKKYLCAAEAKECDIIIRRAGKGEIIATLDGEKRELDEEVLVIADKEKAIAIAGVMGGENSEISDDTESVIIESANFDFISVRKTSQRLGLRTEASARFEKSLDPNLCETAAIRTVELIKQICPEAKIIGLMADEKSFQLNQGPIEISMHWLNKFIGQELDNKRVIKILGNLGFEATKKEKVISVLIPTWRATKDISIKEDLAEEVARIIGYDHLENVMPLVAMIPPERNMEWELLKKIRLCLSGSPAMTEVYNYSFVGEEQLQKLGLDSSSHLKLMNPIVKQHSLCRLSLVPNLLGNIKTNQARFDDIKLFEIGNIYSSLEGSMKKGGNDLSNLPFQEKRIGLIFAGENRDNVFFEAKGAIENLFAKFSLNPFFEPLENGQVWSEAGANTLISVDGKEIGMLSLVNREALKRLGIKKQVAVAEISVREFQKAEAQKQKKFTGFEKFPPVIRDLAFVINKKTLYNDIRKEIINFHEYIKSVDLFDVYLGDKIGKDKKNMAFHIIYQTDRTMTAVEIDELQGRLVKRLEERFEAVIRDF
jgi:phenylalanyl-tRNA synthetase beta chain